ncbi:AAA family ATPase [Acinetobacter johnsonii]|uniref:AAA family ATPase n=1 Tax=Acinetobacter johnsonii TaxID=40214 RepID=UPI003D173873
MIALHQVVKNWLHTKEDWLQQATELILSKGLLDDNDINILAVHLKTTVGQQVTTTREFPELGSTHTLADEIRVKSIGEIVGIENLNPRTPLEFGTGNLCVIYGHNGSGKSGYTRLLKKAAGKTLAKELKHNVFQPVPSERKAKISFSIGANEHPHEWHANSTAIPALQAMDIFDTDVAINYLARDNEATYAPPLVSLFGKLVETVTRVKVRLETQRDALASTLPSLLAEFGQTKLGLQYNNLNANSDAQKVAVWTQEDEQALVQLTARLATADPVAVAKRKRANKDQILQIVTEIKNTAAAYSDESLQSIKAKRKDALEKRKIAQETSQVQSAKLEGIGSSTWKALWEAARYYSQVAYPQRDFPVTDNAQCLLCQQPLDGEAQQRLHDFERFVQGNIEQTASAAEREYKSRLSSLPIPYSEQKVIQDCQSAAIDDVTLLESIASFWRSITETHTAILAGEEGIAIQVPVSIVEILEVNANALEAEAKQYDQDAASFDRTMATKEKLELDAKQWVSAQAAAIDTEVLRLKEISKFEGWIKRTSTSQITQKGGEIAEAAITEAYITRFTEELAHLKADRIKVEIAKTKAAKGKTLHGIRLKGSVDGSAKPDEILSEGERRIVSLAAFLADVSEKPHASTFIFDDPISSLDQDFELAVASRLVQLARTRQVLVFTHRLSFLVALEDAAKKMGDVWKKQHHTQKWIETFSGVSGLVALENARNTNTKKANNILLDKLADAKKRGEQDGGDVYRSLASGLCSEIRILLERTVENDLLGSIVLRYRTSVTTDNKLAKLATIKSEDCKFIDDLMTKYSTLVHSQSTENPIAIPEEPELKKDLEGLKSWREEFEKRPVAGVANI